jgi:hypothetical protein
MYSCFCAALCCAVLCCHTHTHAAKVVFQAESPDEKALIEAACENQYFFYHREPKAFKVGKLEINGTEIRVNVRGEPVVCTLTLCLG